MGRSGGEERGEEEEEGGQHVGAAAEPEVMRAHTDKVQVSVKISLAAHIFFAEFPPGATKGMKRGELTRREKVAEKYVVCSRGDAIGRRFRRCC